MSKQALRKTCQYITLIAIMMGYILPLVFFVWLLKTLCPGCHGTIHWSTQWPEFIGMLIGFIMYQFVAYFLYMFLQGIVLFFCIRWYLRKQYSFADTIQVIGKQEHFELAEKTIGDLSVWHWICVWDRNFTTRIIYTAYGNNAASL